MLTLKDIQTAREEGLGCLVTSPVVVSLGLSSVTGTDVFLKLENMQRTGSFKDRGAFRKLSKLKASGGVRGIIAASAGNHAQAVSCFGSKLGFQVTIVMPEETAQNKIVATRRWGATLHLEGRNFDEAMEFALRRASEEKLAFVHAFDDEEVIAGQGTVGLELLEQVPDLECVVVPVGGGGLASGLALAIKELSPKCRVIGVQAEQFPFVERAWRGQSWNPLAHPPPTIADGIAIKKVGEKTLPILKKYLDDMVTVNEEEIANAVFELMERSKVIAEGAGAAASAAILSGKVGASGGKIVSLVSGGNIDVNLISRVIEKGLVRSGRLLRLSVVIPDRPGGLKAFSGLLADLKANILQIHHERVSAAIPLSTTGTEAVIETRGPEHSEEIILKVREAGYQVQVRS